MWSHTNSSLFLLFQDKSKPSLPPQQVTLILIGEYPYMRKILIVRQ